MPTSTSAAPVELEPLDPNRLYTYEQAAPYLSVTWWQVRNMVRDGRLGYVRTGEHRGRRVSGQDILDYIARNRVPADA